jgi:acyl carrier protein
MSSPNPSTTPPLDDSTVRAIIKEEVSRLTERSLAPDAVPDDVLLFNVSEDGAENLGLDSLDAIEIVMAIEDHCGVEIPEDIDLKVLATVDTLASYVERLMGQPA